MALRKFGMPMIADRPMTAADYFAMPLTAERYELLEGSLVYMPSPTLNHQHVVGRIYVATLIFADSHGGIAIIAPADVELSDKTVLQPDVAYIAPAREAIATDHVHGAPDLVVEVTSPGTKTKDRRDKLPLYARYGVREAWIVDPRRLEVIVFTNANGRFSQTAVVAFGETIPSTIVTVGDGGLARFKAG